MVFMVYYPVSLLHVEKQKVEESFLCKETTRKTCIDEAKSLFKKINQFYKSIPELSSTDLDNIAMHAFSEEDFCNSCHEMCISCLDSLKDYYCNNGYIDNLFYFQDSISSLESKQKRIKCKSAAFDTVQSSMKAVEEKLSMNCRILKMKCLLCASYYYSGIVFGIAKDVKESQETLSSLLLSPSSHDDKLLRILTTTI